MDISRKPCCPAKLLLSFFFFLCLTLTYSQSPGFYLQTDRTNIKAGESFELNVVLENLDTKDIQLPELTPFKIVQGPNLSTSISIINGKRSSTFTRQYILVAPAKGSYEIGPATVKIGSKTLKSNTLKIQVDPEELIKSNGVSGDKETFVRLEVSSASAYIGQQLTLNYVLYTRQNIQSYDFLDALDFEGFYAQPLQDIRDQPQRKTINGKEYYTQVVRRVVLFPQKTGKYTIGPSRYTYDVPVENGRSSFFFTETRKEQGVSNSIKINIGGLPVPGPASFSGAVGDFTMKATISASNVAVGESVVIKMEIEGDGDSKIVQAPVLETPVGFDQYSPSTTRDETHIRGDKIYMLKQFEYTMVPQKDSMYILRPEFTYFSTSGGKYETIQAGPFTIHVSAHPINKSSAKQDTQAYALPLMSEDMTLVNSDAGFFGSFLYWIILAGIIVITIGSVYARSKYIRRKKSQEASLLTHYARSLALLEKAEPLTSSPDPKPLYDEIAQVLISYVMHTFDIPHMDSGTEKTVQYMKEYGISDDLILRYTQLRNKCDLGLFAGQFTEGKNILDAAKSIIRDLEQHIEPHSVKS